MDWNNLRDTVAGMTLYDVKAGVRKVQNGRLDDAAAWTSADRPSQLS